MARVRKDVGRAQQVKAMALETVRGRALLGPLQPKAKKKTSSRGIGRAAADKLMREVDEKIENQDFASFTVKHWVAFFCWIHDAVYDLDCLDEVRVEWNAAASAVQRLLNEEFDNDDESFAEYMKWIAKDEERAELWRRSNRRSGRRLRWRDVFLLRARLNDYRLFQARTSGPQ